MRSKKPNGRQEEYQRYIRQRSEADVLRDRHQPGVIHATDQVALGGGWSWWRLPDYGACRCTCRRGWTCEACTAWREPKEVGCV